MNDLPFPRRKRILMLTTDVVIDRRILHEAESLIDAGYEVILLAGSPTKQSSHEVVGRVKVHRLGFDGWDPRIPRPTWIMRRLTNIEARSSKRPSVGDTLQPESTSVGLPASASRKAPSLLAIMKRTVWIAINLSARFASFVLRKLAWVFWMCLRVIRRLTGMISPHEYLYYKEALFYRPDIVHAHDLTMLAPGVFLKQRFNVPLVYDMHESYPDQPRMSKGMRRRLLRAERRFVPEADVVITVNDLLLQFVHERYNLPNRAVVQNAISAPDFDRSRRYDRFREDYPELAGKFLVLYQGWVAPERNLETAIRAMSLVKAPDLVLLIMGYGEYADELRKLAKEVGVTDRVVFVPAKGQEELLSYSASADIGLIPYPTGNDVNTHLVSPNKLYEFIAARLPILTNRLPFVERLVRSEGFGEVADLDDASAFARSLDGLDRSRLAEYRDRLAKEGWRFEWPAEQHRLLEVYDKLPTGVECDARPSPA